jgi:predicted transposase YbfD/YdcC
MPPKTGFAWPNKCVGEKSNEITTIPALMDMLAIESCVVTIDAMGCQQDIA